MSRTEAGPSKIVDRHLSERDSCILEDKTKAIKQLRNIEDELAALLVESNNCDFEVTTREVFRKTLYEVLATVRTLCQGIERSSLSPEKQPLLKLLIDERMRRAADLNAEICKDFAAGRIRTDQESLSTYLRVLNTAMSQLDLEFGSRIA